MRVADESVCERITNTYPTIPNLVPPHPHTPTDSPYPHRRSRRPPTVRSVSVHVAYRATLSQPHLSIHTPSTIVLTRPHTHTPLSTRTPPPPHKLACCRRSAFTRRTNTRHIAPASSGHICSAYTPTLHTPTGGARINRSLYTRSVYPTPHTPSHVHSPPPPPTRPLPNTTHTPPHLPPSVPRSATALRPPPRTRLCRGPRDGAVCGTTPTPTRPLPSHTTPLVITQAPSTAAPTSVPRTRRSPRAPSRRPHHRPFVRRHRTRHLTFTDPRTAAYHRGW